MNAQKVRSFYPPKLQERVIKFMEKKNRRKNVYTAQGDTFICFTSP